MSQWEKWDRSDHARSVGLFVDPVVDRLARDPTELDDLFVIVGLVGQAPRKNVWRIYLNHALTEFVEVHEDDVVYVRSTDGDRSRIWLHSGARVRHVSNRAVRAEETPRVGRVGRGPSGVSDEAVYLSGPIAGWGEWGAGGGGVLEEEGGPQPGGSTCAKCPGTN